MQDIQSYLSMIINNNTISLLLNIYSLDSLFFSLFSLSFVVRVLDCQQWCWLYVRNSMVRGIFHRQHFSFWYGIVSFRNVCTGEKWLG